MYFFLNHSSFCYISAILYLDVFVVKLFESLEALTLDDACLLEQLLLLAEKVLLKENAAR